MQQQKQNPQLILANLVTSLHAKVRIHYQQVSNVLEIFPQTSTVQLQ